jgi:hypothetical protein
MEPVYVCTCGHRLDAHDDETRQCVACGECCPFKFDARRSIGMTARSILAALEARDAANKIRPDVRVAFSKVAGS